MARAMEDAEANLGRARRLTRLFMIFLSHDAATIAAGLYVRPQYVLIYEYLFLFMNNNQVFLVWSMAFESSVRC